MALKAATLLNRVCIGMKTIYSTLGLSLAVVVVCV